MFQPLPEQEELSKANLSIIDKTFYMEVWRTRSPYCECCGEPLYEPYLYMFHHILEKRDKKGRYDDYSMYRHCLWNIMLLCWQCHDAYERNPDTRLFIVMAKQFLLDMLDQEFEFDQDDIWLKGEIVETILINQLFGNTRITIL